MRRCFKVTSKTSKKGNVLCTIPQGTFIPNSVLIGPVVLEGKSLGKWLTTEAAHDNSSPGLWPRGLKT